jgi:hypothetical protein
MDHGSISIIDLAIEFCLFLPKKIQSSLKKISIPIQIVFGWQVINF